MAKKPYYKEMEQRISDLESELKEHKKEKTAEFERLADRSQDAIYHYDVKLRRYFYFNKIALDLYGDAKKLTTKSVMLHIHPEDREKVKKAAIDSMVPGCNVGEVEYRFQPSDGSYRWMHDKWIVKRDSSGKPTAIEGIVRDNTERKRAEEALQESEERYRELANSIADVFFAMDNQLRYTFWNKASENLTGILAKDALGKSLYDLFPDVKGTIAEDAYLEVLNSQQPKSFINRYQIGDKDYFFEVNAYPSEDGLSVFTKDITDRKRAEAMLRDSEERFRLLFNNMSIGVAVVDKDGYVLTANKADCQYLGYSQEEIKGMHFTEFTYSEDLDLDTNLYEDLVKGNIDHYCIDKRYLRKDGKIVWGRLSVSMIKDDAGEPLYTVISCEDIEKRKQAEEKLRKSEERFRHLSEATFEAIAIHDGGVAVSANDQYFEMFGYEPNELLGKQVIPLTVAPEAREFMKKQISTGGLGPYESIGLRKDGTKFPMEIRVKEMEYGGRKVRVGAVMDITERELAEEALRESEEKYRSLVESTEDNIYLVDENLRYLFANEKYRSRFSLPVDKIIGSKYGEFHSKEGTKIFAEKINKVFETGKSLSYDYRSERDGNYFIRTLSPIKDQKGTAISVTVVSKDITGRKHVEDALRESEARFRKAFDHAAFGMALVNPDGHFLKVNSYLCQMLGYTEEELLTKVFNDVTHPDDYQIGLDILCQVVEGTIPFGWAEKRYLNKDGSVVWGMLSTSLVRDSAGNPMYLVSHVQDITERKKADEALKESNKKLLVEYSQRKLLSKRLIDLLEKERHEIAMELHDHIGQTLASLKMNLEMIRGQIKPAGTKLASQISDAEEKAIQALKDIRSVSHGLRPPVIDTLGLVSSLRELLNEIQKGTDPKIHFFNRNIPKRFDKDKELAIYRITQESITNVLKHSQAKNVHVNLVKKSGVLSLSIEDDGIGLDQDEALKVSKWKGPLGLVIMRERAEQLAGEFTIESQIGRGTHVLVEIPV